jgi:membrane protein DedA with SNARE-associated domain
VSSDFLNFITAHGSLALFGLLVLGIVGLPVPDETLLLAAGVLISHDRLGAPQTYLAALAGALVGITTSYTIGRAAGMTVIKKYGPRLRLESTRIEYVQRFFRRSGKWLLMFGYFLPGIRHFSALVAGAANVEFGFFARFAYVGGTIWSMSFLTLGMYLGDRWEPLADELHERGWLLVGLIAAGIVLVIVARKVRRRWALAQQQKEASSTSKFELRS